MNELKEMILAICFLISVLTALMFYTFVKHELFFEMCRDGDCKIYEVKLVSGKVR